MSILKRSSKVAAGFFIVLLVSIIIVYFSYLSPQQRAKRHLDFVHQSINEVHPAILEPDAIAFLSWHKHGHQKAKELLPHVHTEADEAALLRFYMAGYQDSHLNGYLDKKPFSKLDVKDELWTGWLLKATNTGYEVIYRKEGDTFPPERAKLISCDGQAIDGLLHKHSESPDESNAIPPPNDKWESAIKLILITDKTCVSACLDFVDKAKLVPNLLHLGEPTNADTVYTEIARMQSEYMEETYNFSVPVKKWNKRMRKDNQPYIPDVIYEGDMNDDAALQQWVLAQAEQHFGKQ